MFVFFLEKAGFLLDSIDVPMAGVNETQKIANLLICKLHNHYAILISTFDYIIILLIASKAIPQSHFDS